MSLDTVWRVYYRIMKPQIGECPVEDVVLKRLTNTWKMEFLLINRSISF